MSDKQEEGLEPIEEKVVQFYGDELVAVRVEDGTIFVPVRRLCENLGVAWTPQWQRIQRNEVLAEAVKSIIVTITDSRPRRGPKQAEMVCLPLKFIPGWLFGIQASRVREELRPKLIHYQRECFDALWEAFKTDILPVVEPSQAPGDLSPAERAVQIARALYELSLSQLEMERRLAQQETDVIRAHMRLDRAGEAFGSHEQRLKRIEMTIAGGKTITDEQAATISEAVKALAFELGRRRGDPGRNPYQQIYAEMYRKFRVPAYRSIPLKSFPAVMEWLKEWWQRVTDAPPPFDSGGGDEE
jgi:hypothetical protein